LIDSAVARRLLPDLIVWPETSYPYGYITVDPAISSEELEKQVKSIGPTWSGKAWLSRMEAIASDLRAWTDRVRVPMLVGTTRYDHATFPGGPVGGALRRFNAAILFEPNRQVLHIYHKMHLVPFGEYFPLIESLPWLRALTPYRGEKLH